MRSKMRPRVGVDAIDDDAVQVGTLGILGAIDELHLGEAHTEDDEEHDDGDAQHAYVAARPVAAETGVDAPIADKAHRLELRLLEVEGARRPADPTAEAIYHREHYRIEGGAGSTISTKTAPKSGLAPEARATVEKTARAQAPAPRATIRTRA